MSRESRSSSFSNVAVVAVTGIAGVVARVEVEEGRGVDLWLHESRLEEIEGVVEWDMDVAKIHGQHHWKLGM